MKLFIGEKEATEEMSVVTSKGHSGILNSWREPHKPSSTGRVYVTLDGETSQSEFFPGVIGAEFRDIQITDHYFTFGTDHKYGPGYTKIKAKTSKEARQTMFNRFGNQWAFQYDDLTKLHPHDTIKEVVWREPVVVEHECGENCDFYPEQCVGDMSDCRREHF
jgi:hypothetical protein